MYSSNDCRTRTRTPSFGEKCIPIEVYKNTNLALENNVFIKETRLYWEFKFKVWYVTAPGKYLPIDTSLVKMGPSAKGVKEIVNSKIIYNVINVFFYKINLFPQHLKGLLKASLKRKGKMHI